MSELCDQCGTELGMLSRETATTHDGRQVIVCNSCAEKMRGGLFGGVLGPAQPRPQVGAAPTAMGSPDPALPPGFGAGKPAARSRGLIVISGVLVLTSAIVTTLFVTSSKREPDEVTVVVAPKPVRAAAAPRKPKKRADTEKALAQARADAWTGESEFVCGDREKLTLNGKRTESAGVRAQGDCQLTLVNCDLTASPALKVSGTAQVTVRGGKLTSTDRSGVRVGEDTKLTIEGAEVVGTMVAIRVEKGAKLTMKNATIHQHANVDTERTPWPSALELKDGAEVAMEGGSIRWTRQGVKTDKTALVVLRNVSVSVDAMPGEERDTAPLSLSGASTALVVGGELKGQEFSILANDSAVVTVEGTELKGNWGRADNATVTVSKESPNADKSLAELRGLAREGFAARKAEHERLDAYSHFACAGVFECYEEQNFKGKVAGTVTTRVNGEGRAVSTVTQGVSGRVASCIRKFNKETQIPTFQGPPGKLVCKYSGTIAGSSRMVSVREVFVRDKERAKTREPGTERREPGRRREAPPAPPKPIPTADEFAF